MISILLLCWGEYGWLVESWKASWKRLGPEMPEVRVTDWPPERMQHPSNFSRLLRGELIDIKHPVVLLSPADTFPITMPPAHSLHWLQNAARYILDSANVVRFGFVHDPALAAYGEPVGAVPFPGIIYRCAQWQHCSGPGGLSMETALWNRAHLVSLLLDGWSIAQVESTGSEWMRERRPDLVSVGLVPGLLHTAKLVDHFQPNVVRDLGRLCSADAEAVRRAMPANWKEEP
jgi:hypothetical protein